MCPLIYRILKSTLQSNNQFYTYISIGFIMMLVFHIFWKCWSGNGSFSPDGDSLPLSHKEDRLLLVIWLVLVWYLTILIIVVESERAELEGLPIRKSSPKRRNKAIRKKEMKMKKVASKENENEGYTNLWTRSRYGEPEQTPVW